MAEVIVIRKARDLRIYINGILHLHLLIKDYVGMQSWLEDSQKAMYFIEIYTATNDILLEYVEYDIWIKILKLIDQNI